MSTAVCTPQQYILTFKINLFLQNVLMLLN
jgi:hypothetical protein